MYKGENLGEIKGP